MSDFIVTTTQDVVDSGDGVTSLREALAEAAANGGSDTIRFASGLAGGKVTLNSALQVADADGVTIDGDTDGNGTSDITISGDTNGSGVADAGDSRILDVLAGATATLTNLVIEDGYAVGANGTNGSAGVNAPYLSAGFATEGGNGSGGASATVIANGGTLTLLNVEINDCAAIGGAGGNGGRGGEGVQSSIFTFKMGAGGGGGGSGGEAAVVYNSGQLAIDGVTAEGNSATGGAGGNGGAAGSGGITADSFAPHGGGAGSGGQASIVSGPGSTTIENSALLGNTSTGGTGGQGGGGGHTHNYFSNSNYTSPGGAGGNGGNASTTVNSGSLSFDQLLIANEHVSGGAGGNGGSGASAGSAGTTSTFSLGNAPTLSGSNIFTVTTLDDVVDANDGLLSLREVTEWAQGPISVTFDASLAGGTMTLQSVLSIASGQVLAIDGDLDNDGSADITLSGDRNGSGTADFGDTSLLYVASGATLDIDGLNLSGGYAQGADGSDGAPNTTIPDQFLYQYYFFNPANAAYLGEDRFQGPAGGAGGSAAGALYNAGTVSITNSVISNSRAVGGDGGSGTPTRDALVQHAFDAWIYSPLNFNEVSGFGGGDGGGGGGAAGGIFNASTGTITISNVDFVGNAATAGQAGAATAGGDATDLGAVAGYINASQNVPPGYGGFGGDGGQGGTAAAHIINAGTATITSSSFTGGTAVSTQGTAGSSGGTGSAHGIGGYSGTAGYDGVAGHNGATGLSCGILNTGNLTGNLAIGTTDLSTQGLDLASDGSNDVSLGASAGSVTVTTLDDNGNPESDGFIITAVDAVRAEANSGSTSFTFLVTRTGDVSGASSVDYSVAGSGPNAATADDFDGGFASGTLAFEAGETARIVAIHVAADGMPESDETFQVTLSDAANGETIALATAGGTILNDDALFAIAADSAQLSEGDTGTTDFTFTVTRTTSQYVGSVAWSVAGSGDDAANASDFGGALPTGVIEFAVGETERTITVAVSGDTLAEGDEGFAVSLSSPVGGAIETASASGLIENDDADFSIAAATADRAEGHAGATAFTFTVTRGADLAGIVSVDYAVVGSGAAAADVSDFVGGALPSGTVTFADGETERTITIEVASDLAVEGDETFAVNLVNAVGGSIASGPVTGTIRNDDTQFSVAQDVSSGPEGTPLTFRVTRTGLATAEQTVNYAVTGSGSNAATGRDFVGGALPSGQVTFLAGETEQTITVAVQSDGVAESDETFSVSLVASPLDTTIGAVSAAGQIRNDDTAYSAFAVDSILGEGDSGTTALEVMVYRSGLVDQASALDWQVSAGTADAADFAGGSLPSGQVTFAAGETARTIVILVAGDRSGEADETFRVDFRTTGGPTVVSSVEITIADDDTIEGTAADDVLNGTASNDRMLGLSGNDALYGQSGADDLYGGEGNDSLVGGAGNDTMTGGVGNDLYVVASSGDRVIELAHEGTADVVRSSIDYLLVANVEHLTLIGTSAIDGTGNAAANGLRGNGAANVLDGREGRDVLVGGGGADTFHFSTALTSGNIDRIADFTHSEDRIELDQAIFAAMSQGALDADAFHVIGSGEARDAEDRILYNRTTGALYYDADGNAAGGSAAIVFAVLAGAPADVNHEDFLVV